MSMNAIAIVRIAPETIRQALPATDEEDVRRGATGGPVRIRALSNATAIYLGVPLTESPESLGLELATLLGDVLLAHDEARGVPVYPESYALEADSWDDAIAELGDGADWIPLPVPGGAAMPDLSALLGASGAAQLQGFAKQLEGEDGGALLQQAMQMAQQLAQSGALEGLAQQLAGAASNPKEALANMGMGPDALGAMGLDLGAIAKQAQSMLADNPELEAQLRAQLGGAAPDEEE